MKEKLISWAVGMVLERLTGEQISQWLCSGLDMLEKAVIASPNKYDDMTVLPMIELAREVVACKK